MKPTQSGPKGRPDFLLLVMTLILVGFGLVMVFSASSNTAVYFQRFNNDALYFTKRQLMWAGLGLFMMMVIMNIHYAKFKRGFIIYFIPVFIMLALVPFIGDIRNNARSWLGIGGVLGVQPTEFAKLAIILYLGSLIAKKGDKFRDFKRGLLPVMIVIGIFCFLIMLQPDLGSCLILAATAVVIIIAGGSNLKHVFYSGAIASAVVAVIVTISMLNDTKDQWGYRIARFTSYLDPWAYASGSGYQLLRSLEALGHGGLTGAGFGHGIQKLHYLPLAYNDFIFAVIAEEFGFIGSTLFLFFFLAFLWRCLIVALRCPDMYGTIVGIGIVALLSIQAVVNIGGVIGVIPITGVTLPFISYGGSSMLVTLMCMGVLLSISREQNRQEREAEQPRKRTTKQIRTV